MSSFVDVDDFDFDDVRPDSYTPPTLEQRVAQGHRTVAAFAGIAGDELFCVKGTILDSACDDEGLWLVQVGSKLFKTASTYSSTYSSAAC